MRKFFCLAIILFLISASIAQEIAITIDDAPFRDTLLFSGAERTQLLIDNLIKANAPDALIFIITGNIDRESMKRIEAYTEAGFHIANHSHSHFSADTEATDIYIQDITQAHSILSTLDNVLPFYRYPYLHQGSDRKTRDLIREHIRSFGYEIGYVTIDNYEWYMDALLQTAVNQGKDVNYGALKDVYIKTVWETISFYDDIAQQTLGRSPKHVLLLHETDITAMYIADLVDYIRAQGWKIISPQEAYTDPIASIIPDVLFNKQGRIAAIAHDQGWKPDRLRHESENQAFLDDLFKRQDIFK